MEYEGKILEANLIPLVEVVDSVMQLNVRLPYKIVPTENRGSLEDLSKLFEFKIISYDNWDTADMVGRDCVIQKTDDGYEFVRYID